MINLYSLVDIIILTLSVMTSLVGIFLLCFVFVYILDVIITSIVESIRLLITFLIEGNRHNYVLIGRRVTLGRNKLKIKFIYKNINTGKIKITSRRYR